MAKVEGNAENWHGHVTCLSVAPEFRRQGASRELMNVFEKTSEMYAFICFFLNSFLLSFNHDLFP
jgi:N-terminal acetyltransferase B complex catalytic subunit